MNVAQACTTEGTDGAAGARHTVLTYKEPSIDAAGGSEPEHEATAADAMVFDVILRALGTINLVAFEKQCANSRFTAKGGDMLRDPGRRSRDRRHVP